MKSIKMNYIEIDFETINLNVNDELIALLNEHGFEGFEENDRWLKAFIPEDKFNADEFEKLIDKLSSVTYSKTTIENINWNKQWEESFEPVVVDDFVAIRAHFHQPIKGIQHEIIITPKMSFGTGHHATTFLMMQQMKNLDFTGKTVLDFGTGTGVLAILAEKLHAKSILAIDNDEWSITNTTENTRQNNCSGINIELHDEIPKGNTYDIILANINLNVIASNMPSIVQSSKPGTQILFSGFLKENENAIKSALSDAGLTYISTSQKGEWLCIHAQKM